MRYRPIYQFNFKTFMEDENKEVPVEAGIATTEEVVEEETVDEGIMPEV